MRLKANTVAIELEAHGLFATSVEAVTKYGRYSTATLAKLIAGAYGGGCGKASTAAYWRAHGRAVLAIVYASMVEPRDDYRARTPEVITEQKLSDALVHVLDRMGCKPETLEQAAEAVYPDFGGPAFRDALVAYGRGTAALKLVYDGVHDGTGKRGGGR